MPSLGDPEKHFCYSCDGAGEDTSCFSGELPVCKGAGASVVRRTGLLTQLCLRAGPQPLAADGDRG